jgi:hypothetical protein
MSGATTPTVIRFLSGLVFAGAILAQNFPPQFVVDPGTHSRPINAISVDSNETFLVSGSSDKTVRLWSLQDGGKLVQTLHLAVSAASPTEGEVYAVALSPDDNIIAYGGHTGFAFRNNSGSFFTYNRKTNLITEHKGFQSDITSVAFNSDGKYLVYSARAAAWWESPYQASPPFQVSGAVAADVARLAQADVLTVLHKDPQNTAAPISMRIHKIGPSGLSPANDDGAGCPNADSLRFTPDTSCG